MGNGLFLADGGGEWEALREMQGRAALREHLLGLLELARALDAGFILDAPVYQSRGLPLSATEAEAIDQWAIAFASELREAAALSHPVLLQVTLSSFPEWAGEWRIVNDETERLLMRQLGRLTTSGIDLVGGPAFSDAGRAVAFIETVGAAGLPVVVTLAIDTQGRLGDGQPLREAIEAVDAFTGAEAAWFGVRCADPAHLVTALAGEGGWARRIRALRIEHGDPAADPTDLRRSYAELAARAPSVEIADLAGGQGLRHAAAMARALRVRTTAA
jgi:homocysteine S-methyltransferase